MWRRRVQAGEGSTERTICQQDTGHTHTHIHTDVKIPDIERAPFFFVAMAMAAVDRLCIYGGVSRRCSP